MTEATTPAPATQPAATEAKEKKFVFHAFVSTPRGSQVVTGTKKTELQARIDSLGEEVQIVSIVKGRKIEFAERKQLAFL